MKSKQMLKQNIKLNQKGNREMKNLQGRIITVVLTIFLASLAFMGCEQSSPLAANGLSEPTASPKNELKFITWGDKSQSLNKVIEKTGWFSKSWGGLLMLNSNYSFWGSNVDTTQPSISVTFYAKPGSVSESIELSMSMDNQIIGGNIDMKFGPSGTVFTPAAYLSITAENIDLTGVDPATVNIFYVNEQTGEWEPIPSESITVDVAIGKIVVKNARIPHFSRYALARS